MTKARKQPKLDVESVRQAAAGRWLEILQSVAGIPADALDGQHHPCPKCGGDDRFRLIDQAAGAVLCNQCFSSKNGDGFAAVAWSRGVKFPEAVQLVADYLGVAASKGDTDPAKDLRWMEWSSALVAMFLQKKPGVTEAALLANGARMARYKDKFTVIALPIIGQDLDTTKPVGWALLNYNGGTLPKWNKEGIVVGQVKSKLTYGSKPGLVGTFAIERLKVAGLVELCWKVEGITDLPALFAIIPEQLRERHVVITNANGAGELPRWPASVLARVSTNVIHDADQPGQVGAEQWSTGVAAQATEGVVVRNPQLPYTIEEKHGKDLRDFINEKHTYADLLNIAEQAKPVTVAKTESGEVDFAKVPYPVQELMLKKLQIEVLYEEAGRIHIFSTFTKKSHIIPLINRLQKAELITYCGAPAKECVSKEPDGETSWSIEDIREAIALAASKCLEEHEGRGMGIWQGLDEEQNQTDTIVLVGRTEAARWNGDKVLRRILTPRADGLMLDFGQGKNWFKFAALEKLLTDAADLEWRRAVINDTVNLLKGWRWKNPDTDPLLLTGLILATPVQTIFDYRPLIALTGETNAGKSYFFTTLGGSINRRGIFGSLAYRPDQVSEAGVRQRIRNTAIAVLLDEIEDSSDRNKILKMLRTATAGGVISKGTGGNQKGIDFIVRHIVWTSAIESGLHGHADINRYIQFELSRAREGEGGMLALADDKWLQAHGQKLLAISIRSAIHARRITAGLKDTQVAGVHPRTIEGFSVPVAMLMAAEDQPVEVARVFLSEMLSTVDRTEQALTDQGELLDAILTASVHLDARSGIKTVSQVLGSPALRMDYSQRMESVGVKLLEDESVFIAPKLVAHQLLKGTPWERMRIDQILMRLKGAERKQLRLGGRAVRGLTVPADVADITTNGQQEF